MNDDVAPRFDSQRTERGGQLFRRNGFSAQLQIERRCRCLSFPKSLSRDVATAGEEFGGDGGSLSCFGNINGFLLNRLLNIVDH